MQSCCINLKYLTFIILLSLTWWVPGTYSNITSKGTPLFLNAVNGVPFAAFTSPLYNSPGPPTFTRPFTPDQGIVQIRWGLPAYPDQSLETSAYILRDHPLVGTTPVTLGEEFTVATIHHYNRPINGSFITSFTMQLTVDLTVFGFSLPPLVFDNLEVLHAETLNPLADIATWNSPQIDREFSHGGINYTFSLIGIPATYDPDCLGQCFITLEGTDNEAPVVAVITSTPIPEPSTYLMLSSMIGIIMLYRHIASKKAKAKVKVSMRQNDKKTG